MGPYYSSAESLKSKFILACLYETIKIFQFYGFKTSAIVCDGASANLATLKTTIGCSGAFGASTTSETRYGIPSPKFANPFSPPDMVYWIVCPSHQAWYYHDCIIGIFTHCYSAVKKHDKRPVLFKTWRHKDFTFGGVKFGWADIEVYVNEWCTHLITVKSAHQNTHNFFCKWLDEITEKGIFLIIEAIEH